MVINAPIWPMIILLEDGKCGGKEGCPLTFLVRRCINHWEDAVVIIKG